MSERDAGSEGTDSRGINQLAADVSAGIEAILNGAQERAKARLALAELVGLVVSLSGETLSLKEKVGTLQQERDTLENRWLADNERAVAAEAERDRLQKIERNNSVLFDKMKAAEAALESNTAEWVRINVEEWERIATEQGIPFLLDHLGLDGLANEVNGMKAALADSLKENQDLRKQVETTRHALAEIEDTEWGNAAHDVSGPNEIARRALADAEDGDA